MNHLLLVLDDGIGTYNLYLIYNDDDDDDATRKEKKINNKNKLNVVYRLHYAS